MDINFMLVLMGVMFIIFGIIMVVDPVTVVRKADLIETTPATMEVVGIDFENDIVYLVDPNGYRWSFEGVEDWCIGDLVSCTMDTKGTKSILDDEIKDKKYSGYNMR